MLKRGEKGRRMRMGKGVENERKMRGRNRNRRGRMSPKPNYVVYFLPVIYFHGNTSTLMKI